MGTFGILFLGPHLPPQSLPLRLVRDHHLLSPGLVTSDKESAAHILNRKDGGNLQGVIVGGAQEALNARPGTCTLLLREPQGLHQARPDGWVSRKRALGSPGDWRELYFGRKTAETNGDSILAERSSVHSQYQRYFGEQCTISCSNTQERLQRGDLVIKGTRWEGIYCPKLTLDLRPVGSGIMGFEAYCRAVLLIRSIFEESKLTGAEEIVLQC